MKHLNSYIEMDPADVADRCQKMIRRILDDREELREKAIEKLMLPRRYLFGLITRPGHSRARAHRLVERDKWEYYRVHYANGGCLDRCRALLAQALHASVDRRPMYVSTADFTTFDGGAA